MKTNPHLKIFLVDDDPFCLHIYAKHLENLGYKDVSLFDNGTDCLSALGEQPEVIFLDHGMSPLSGLEVLKKVKAINPDIYVVFLSGQEALEMALNSLKYGAYDYLVKGGDDAQQIQRVLHKIAEVKVLLQENRSALVRSMLLQDRSQSIAAA